MINFFRKIRQNLIQDHRFSKYLLYAFGEIFLVMIGILLALQFNNWNSTKENKKKERWYLTNILDDIYYQTENLDFLELFFEKSISTGKSILSNYNTYQNLHKIDSLNSKLNSLMESATFPNINNTYQEMVSSGQLSLIENSNLSVDIIDYYLYTEDNEITFKNNLDNVFYTQIYPILNKITFVELGSLYIDTKDENSIVENNNFSNYIFDKLKNSEMQLSLLNAIKLKILIETDHLDAVVETKKAGLKLSNEIQNELDKVE